jgi:predicted AlkP superfamily pyrophosphatase or phosphodiesterase
MDKTGRFVTSTYYRDREHAWVRRFNASGVVDRWLGRTWQRLRPDLDYARWSGPDDVSGEGTGYGQGRTFPHPFRQEDRHDYIEAVQTSPMGNTLLLELTRRAIAAEKLGSRDTPDFLSISFSSNDLVGHQWGPDSQEVLDTTLRSDLVIRDLMATLDERVGKGRWVLVLSADHGICPLPEATRSRVRSARRLQPGRLLEEAEDYLDSLYSPGKGEEFGQGQWIERISDQMLYLDRARIARRGLRQEEVETALAKWLITQRGIRAAYTRKQLTGRIDASDSLERQVQRSFYPERSGDVTLVLQPYCLMTTKLTGTTHGSPHSYDTHVPLMVLGPGVRPGARRQRVSPEQAAVILARALGLKPPAKAAVTVPEGLFEKASR